MYQNEDNNVLVKDMKMESYFKKLLNDDNGDIGGQVEDTMSLENYNYYSRIRIIEGKKVLGK